MSRFSLVLFLLACGSNEPAPNTPSEPSPFSEAVDVTSEADGPTRAQVENAPSNDEPAAAELALSVSVTESSGGTRFDVFSADGFPGRAMDPVLHVGDVRLTSYEHVGITTLRFESEHGYPSDVGISLHWGDDVHELMRTDVGATNSEPGELTP